MKKQWNKREFESGTYFRVPINYLVNHLNSYDKKKVYGKEDSIFEAWQNKKEKSICDKLDNGIEPSKLGRIRMNIHPTQETFYVADGISRIRAFKNKNIKKIDVEMGYY